MIVNGGKSTVTRSGVSLRRYSWKRCGLGAPIAEGQVARDQQALAFVTVGEHLKEQFCSRPAERQITKLIANQELGPVELTQKAVELVLLLGLFQALDQVGRRETTYALAESARRQTERRGQVRFTRAGLTDKDYVGTLLEPVAAGQF